MLIPIITARPSHPFLGLMVQMAIIWQVRSTEDRHRNRRMLGYTRLGKLLAVTSKRGIHIRRGERGV